MRTRRIEGTRAELCDLWRARGADTIRSPRFAASLRDAFELYAFKDGRTIGKIFVWGRSGRGYTDVPVLLHTPEPTRWRDHEPSRETEQQARRERDGVADDALFARRHKPMEMLNGALFFQRWDYGDL